MALDEGFDANAMGLALQIPTQNAQVSFASTLTNTIYLTSWTRFRHAKYWTLSLETCFKLPQIAGPTANSVAHPDAVTVRPQHRWMSNNCLEQKWVNIANREPLIFQSAAAVAQQLIQVK